MSREWTAGERVGIAQGCSLRHRGGKVTLPRAPWQQDDPNTEIMDERPASRRAPAGACEVFE